MFWLLVCLIIAAALSPKLFRRLRKSPLARQDLSDLAHRLTVTGHGDGHYQPQAAPLSVGEETCCSILGDWYASKRYEAKVCGRMATEFWVARDLLEVWRVVGYCDAHSLYAKCECEWPSGYYCPTRREAIDLLTVCQVTAS